MNNRYEIVSLVGTLSDGGHLHVSLSNVEWVVIGGHVLGSWFLGDMVVFTTDEIVIGKCEQITF